MDSTPKYLPTGCPISIPDPVKRKASHERTRLDLYDRILIALDEIHTLEHEIDLCDIPDHRGPGTGSARSAGMTTPGGPLGRDGMAFAEKMKRIHGEIERMVYAAEVLCHTDQNGELCAAGCPFESNNGIHCDVKWMRGVLGDHVEQHDVMPQVPPCQCGGRCNK